MAFIPIIFNQGIFWDDWCIYNTIPSARALLYSLSGRPLFGAFFNLLFISPDYGVMIGRFLIFISYFIPGIILDTILTKIKEISTWSRFSIIIIFYLLPVNFSRIALTNLQYGFCFLMFFIAFGLLSLYLENSKLIFKVISIALFLLSFTTESLILFYVIPLFFVLYIHKFNVKKMIINQWWVLLLPLIAIIIKYKFFQPYGLYENFNKPSFSIRAIVNGIHESLRGSFFQVIKESIHTAKVFPFGFLTFFIIIYFLVFKFLKPHKIYEKNLTKVNSLIFCLSGFVIFIIGVLPYILVRKIGTSFDWNSRHQLLTSLGISIFLSFFTDLILSFFINTKNQMKMKALIYCFSISCFAFFNFITYVEYQKDWWKQISLISKIQLQPEIQNATSIFFTDNTQELNARSRSYRDYEYAGIMKSIFRDEKRYGSNQINLNLGEVKTETQWPWYNVTQHTPKPYEYNVKIEYGDSRISNRDVLSLYFFELFNRDKFKNLIGNTIQLKIEKF